MAPRPSLLKGQPGLESQRSLNVHGQTVNYCLRRSRRRTIGLSVDHRGLRVGAPLGAALRDIEALLQKPFNVVPESKIVVRFWLIGIILAVITIVTLKMR